MIRLQELAAVWLLSLLALGANCSGSQSGQIDGPEQSHQQIQLDEGRWFPENREALEQWLQAVADRDWERAPVAVFDWDNTCAYNDVGVLTLLYQLDHLQLRFTPEALAEFLPEEINGVSTLEGGVSLVDVRADLLMAYGELYPHVQSGDIDAARALPAHRDFRSKAAWLFEATYATEGIGAHYALVYLVGWLAGYGSSDVDGLVDAAIAWARDGGQGRISWTTASEGRAGPIEYSFRSGYCPHAEIIDLMRAMDRAGIEVYVVSASGELIVERAAESLGYPVARDRIYGIRVELDGDVLSTTAPPIEQYPITYRPGKVELIRRFIGHDPIFVAGDANTDFEMLTGFPGMEMRLIINRNKHDDDIGTLYSLALTAPEEGSPVTLLQGRDEGECTFHPRRETTALGATEAESLRQP